MIINFYNRGGGGSGSGGTTNYNELSNKPRINNVTLSGNKTASDLNLNKELVPVQDLPYSAADGTVIATSAGTINQAYHYNGNQAWWHMYGEYQGRYQFVDFLFNQDFKIPSGDTETELGILSYNTVLIIKLIAKNSKFYIKYSEDEGETWYEEIEITYESATYNMTAGTKTMALTTVWSMGEPGLVELHSNKSMTVVSADPVTGTVHTYKEVMFKGDDYSDLSNKPAINGNTIDSASTTHSLGIKVGTLDGELHLGHLQNITSSDDGSDISGHTGVLIQWDGSSDMLYRAEAYYSKTWGTSSVATPYYSGSTWYGVDDWTGASHTIKVFDDHSIWFGCARDASQWKFDGEVSGTAKVKYIDGVYSGQPMGTVATAYSEESGATQALGTYQYNGYFWDQLQNNKYFESSTPAPAGLSIHWYDWTDSQTFGFDGKALWAREDCSNDGDYLCHVGAEIQGTGRQYNGVQIADGVITGSGYGMEQVYNTGHWVGKKVDDEGVTYWWHCWVENGKLIWNTSSPIEELDAYGTGTNKQAGLFF